MDNGSTVTMKLLGQQIILLKWDIYYFMTDPTTYYPHRHCHEQPDVGAGHDGESAVWMTVPWMCHRGRGLCHWGCG